MNVTYDKDRTPLYWAAFEGHPEIVKFLIDEGADVELRDEDNVSALGLASRHGYLDVVKILVLDGHVEINSKLDLVYVPNRHEHILNDEEVFPFVEI